MTPSRKKVLDYGPRKALMASFLSGGIPFHKGCLPSTMDSHSALTLAELSVALSLYANRDLIAEFGEALSAGSGINRTRRERRSPTDGPPAVIIHPRVSGQAAFPNIDHS